MAGKKMMTSAVYREIASIINSSKDKELKRRMADHFATAFRKNYPSFDPASWELTTGGKVQGYNIYTGKFED